MLQDPFDLVLASGALVAGRYRVEGPIGRGGFGAVFRASDVASNTEVALKVLLPQVVRHPAGLARFHREAELARRLEHPSTVRLFDFGVTPDGLPFIAWELLRGRSLEDALVHGPLSVRAVAQLAAQVLGSLAEAHSKGIVHRDIKPANVFLCGLGAENVPVKVLDFGLAKTIRAPGEQPGEVLTRQGEVPGTPSYMAPELFAGKDLSPAVDLYALGLVMAEALTARRVFDGASALDILRRQLMPDPVPLPNEVRSSLLGPVIDRATRKPTAERYSSAAEMLADLDQVMRQLPMTNPPPPPSSMTPPRVSGEAPTEMGGSPRDGDTAMAPTAMGLTSAAADTAMAPTSMGPGRGAMGTMKMPAGMGSVRPPSPASSPPPAPMNAGRPRGAGGTWVVEGSRSPPPPVAVTSMSPGHTMPDAPAPPPPASQAPPRAPLIHRLAPFLAAGVFIALIMTATYLTLPRSFFHGDREAHADLVPTSGPKGGRIRTRGRNPPLRAFEKEKVLRSVLTDEGWDVIGVRTETSNAGTGKVVVVTATINRDMKAGVVMFQRFTDENQAGASEASWHISLPEQPLKREGVVTFSVMMIDDPKTAQQLFQAITK